MSRILVVDDEPQILRALQTSLKGAGYEVDVASTAKEALTSAAVRRPDAVILDLVLPDGRGTDVTRELRTWTSVPVIVLSVVDDEEAKVAALDAGADDYVTKPFGLDELLARLRAALRRSDGPGEPVLEIGELHIDLEARAVTVRGDRVQLTPQEYALLALLARGLIVIRGKTGCGSCDGLRCSRSAFAPAPRRGKASCCRDLTLGVASAGCPLRSGT